MINPTDLQDVSQIIADELGSPLSDDEYNSIEIVGDKLKFTLDGNDGVGARAIRALLDKGLLSIIDENMQTNENASTGDGFGRCNCWILLADPNAIWR
jgi:hypothetical protein